MNATHVAVDLDDPAGLQEADRNGLLWSASMAGAQVRSTAAALDEGALDSLRSDERPRTVIWVAGRGAAESAGALLAAALAGAASAPIVVVPEAPPWVGPLDVIVVAGDDPGDPALVSAAATGVRRGSRLAVVAPYEGPLRDVTAGRSVVLGPRLHVADDFALCRYLAAGLAIMHCIDPSMRTDLSALADDLDAEALRNSAGREVFVNPAKSLAERMSGRTVVLAGDNAATLALARHGAAIMLRIAHQPVAATCLADVLVALRGGLGAPSGAPSEPSIFHDEQIDGPVPQRIRSFVLTTGPERPVVTARVGGFDDIDIIDAEDVPDAVPAGTEPSNGAQTTGAGRLEQQLARLAVRLEMTAVYLRLVRG
ncbi:TobH protein [Mycolicibacterium thermoresistibile]